MASVRTFGERTPTGAIEALDGWDYIGLPRLLRKLENAGHPPAFPQGFSKRVVVAQADLSTIGNTDWLRKQLDRARLKPKDTLVIDQATEAFLFADSTDFMSRQLAAFHAAVGASNTDPDQIVLLNANTASEKAHNSWRTRHGIKEQPRVIGMDFYVGEFPLDLKAHFEKFDLFGVVKEAAARSLNQGSRRARKFTCLNHRPRSHRYAVVLFLMAYGHLEEGFVSFAGEHAGRHDAMNISTTDETLKFIDQLEEAPALLSRLEQIWRMSPLVVDRSPDELRAQLWGKRDGKIEQALGWRDASGGDLGIFDSYFEIVTETWFTDDSCQYSTEKIMRPLAGLRPFLVVGTPGVLERLRLYGFRTFHPRIDESYDSMTDPAERMDALLKEIGRLCSMSSSSLHQLMQDLWPAVTHNYAHLWTGALREFRDHCVNETLRKL